MATRDPYLRLAEATDFVDHLPAHAPGTPLDLLLELAGTGAAKKALAAAAGGSLRINEAHLEAGSRFVTVRASLAALDALETAGAVKHAELAESVRHQRTQWPTRFAQPVPLGTDWPHCEASSPTLAAMIDDGCPFAHREFRRGGTNRTRVVTLWDMDPDPEFAFPGSATPVGFFRGREVPGAVLADWMDRCTRDGTVDEDACYEAAGYSALAVELTHGSHLLGRMAGASYGRPDGQDDAAAQSDIAFVQLPRRMGEAPDAGTAHACILDALRYLRRFAERAGYEACVVACAKGSMLGPHDGSSLFERALDAFLAEPGVAFQFVFAAGNGYEDEVHTVLFPRPGRPASVAWMLPEDNEAPGFAELWLDGAAPGQVTVSVQLGAAPRVLPEGKVVEVARWLWALRTGRQVALRAAPTRVSGLSQPAPAGPVTIIAETTAAGSPQRPVALHGYLCWGGGNLGYARRTWQAAWRVPAGSNTVVDGHGTLLGDACGTSEALRVVGGYVGGNEPAWFARARYSAAGPSRGDREGPDFLALSDENPARQGIPGPGTRSGIVKRVWGTSVAAPQAARALINGEPLPAGTGEAPQEMGAGFLV